MGVLIFLFSSFGFVISTAIKDRRDFKEWKSKSESI
jgi:hypothetical protein